MSEARELVKTVYEALSEKKAEDIKIIDISGLTVVADYFIIATGNSVSQVNALVDNVEEKLLEKKCQLKTKEGAASGGWVLMDFGDIIVHIFDRDKRLFYDLERIWRDGVEIDSSDI